LKAFAAPVAEKQHVGRKKKSKMKGEAATVIFLEPARWYMPSQALPERVMLKIRSLPRPDGRVWGMLPRTHAVMVTGLAGDWLQLVYGKHEIAWALVRNQHRIFFEPLTDLALLDKCARANGDSPVNTTLAEHVALVHEDEPDDELEDELDDDTTVRELKSRGGDGGGDDDASLMSGSYASGSAR